MESCFREEEEFDESDAAQSNRSQDGGSNHDIQGDSHSASLGEPYLCLSECECMNGHACMHVCVLSLIHI